jgi:hypothetical protein
LWFVLDEREGVGELDILLVVCFAQKGGRGFGNLIFPLWFVLHKREGGDLGT